MNTTRYLDQPIAEARRTATPQWGMAADGYTLKSGAPTSLQIRLRGSKRWRRVMVWQFSNAGTAFVRIAGLDYVVSDHMIPEVAGGDGTCKLRGEGGDHA